MALTKERLCRCCESKQRSTLFYGFEKLCSFSTIKTGPPVAPPSGELARQRLRGQIFRNASRTSPEKYSVPSAQTGPVPPSSTARATPASMDGAGSAVPPRTRMCSASVSAGMARGVCAATVTNRFASGSRSSSISSTSLSAMMLSRKTNFWPGKRSFRLWTVARIPWFLHVRAALEKLLI